MTNIPYGYCHCGCGQKTNLSSKNDASTNRVKDQPMKFLSGHSSKGSNHYNWNGGRYINGQGYVMIKLPEHPRAGIRGYIAEHILVMEKSLGRFILPPEEVHHFDGDRTNNSIGNLMLFATDKMHKAYEVRLKAFNSCGHYTWRVCGLCHKYDDPKNLDRNGRGRVHKTCRAIWWKSYAANSYKPLKQPKFDPQEIEELMGN